MNHQGIKINLQHHLIFWVMYIAALSFFTSYLLPLTQVLPRVFILTLLHTCLVYFNLLWLFPKFFLERKYFIYISLGIGMILLLSGIQIQLIPPISDGFITSFLNENLRYFIRVAVSMEAIFLLSLLFALVVNFLYRQKREAAIQKEQLLSELRFLKSQLNPHFLFNTLNNVYSLCHLKDDKAAPMVMKLSELMRYMLYDCQEKEVPLAQEIRFIQNFIALQRLKTDWEQQLEVRISGQIEKYKIAPLLFLPFIENLSKHSNLDSQPSAHAQIELAISPTHELSYKMENSIRSTPISQTPSSGIGLSNLQKRLALLYPNQHELYYEKANDIFKVQLTLQLALN